MTSLTFLALRAANLTRHVRYFGDSAEPWGHDDWLVAVGGGVGEALNVVKKLNRARLGMRGNAAQATLEGLQLQLGDELADVVIYLDIIASHFRTEQLGRGHAFGVSDFRRLRLSTEEGYAFSASNLRSLSSAGRALLRHSGKLAELVPLSNGQMAEQCDWVLGAVDQIAFNAVIDLGAAVVRKFNATSEKLGFPERLAV